MTAQSAVRHEFTVTPRSSRSLPERLALRFPGVLGWLRVRFDRLPPSSRLRQRLTPPIARAAYAALNRHDDEVVFGLIYHPDCEFESTLAALGLENRRGRDERMQAQQRWIADFTFSDGWVVREQTFFDHGQALEAAGLDRRELRSGYEG